MAFVPLLRLAVVFCLLVAATSAALHSGSQVWRITSGNTKGHQWLQNVEKRLSAEYKLDFWQFPKSTHQPIDVKIPAEFLGKFNDLLKKYNMTYSVMIADVGALINQQKIQMEERKKVANLTADFDFETYHPYYEIRHWIRDFAFENSHIVSEFIVGRSYEGRQIAGLKISRTSETKKRSVWIQGGIHPDNWIAPATIMYITNQLMADFRFGDDATRATVEKLLDSLDFYILPVLDVDGYAYTWTVDRLWHKTRSPNAGSACVGTDANRNYPFHWGGEESETDPCENMYRGDNAMSEIEIQSVVDFAMARKAEQKFKMFLDVQSYGLRWLAPWGYSFNPTAKAKELSELGDMVVAAVNSVHGQSYITGPLAQTVSINPGTAADWAFSTLKAPYSYTVELRDAGNWGYLLPADQIKPTSEETYAGIKIAGLWVVDEMNNGREE